MANPYADMVEIVNRTSQPLVVRWDGTDFTLAPNYTADGERIQGVTNMIPSVVVEYAKNQHPLMGSEDSMDPSAFQTLVGVVARKGRPQRDELSHLEQNGKLTRVPLDDYLGPNDKVIMGRDKKFRNAEAAMPNLSHMGNIGTVDQNG